MLKWAYVSVIAAEAATAAAERLSLPPTLIDGEYVPLREVRIESEKWCSEARCSLGVGSEEDMFVPPRPLFAAPERSKKESYEGGTLKLNEEEGNELSCL